VTERQNERGRRALAEEIRIGVFICNCGTNIAGFLDAGAVAQYASTLPDVVFTRENLYSCSEAGVTGIKSAIIENKLNRVIVAACTPRTHEPTFRAACAEAGVNPYLFEFVNIREHCSWVHKDDWEGATAKAKDLVRMAVARAALLSEQQPIVASVRRSAAVIGGGVSGMTVALSLAGKGLAVTLIEREKKLGGQVGRLHTLYPSGRDASDYVASMIEKVKGRKNIKVLLGAKVTGVTGYIGNYTVRVQRRGKESDVECGVIVVATGARPLNPEGVFGYDGKNVISAIEFERRLSRGGLKGESFVFINCAGARNPERPYCSKICCMVSIKNALAIKEWNPDVAVHVLYRDLMCYGVENEELLRRAKELGVRFISYSKDDPPVVEGGVVRVAGDVMGRNFEIPFDTVILATPLVPDDGASELSRLLKVPLDADRFFLEAHVKLRPVDFSSDGIFVAGTARWPASTRESVEQSLGAASRASIPLIAGEVEVEPTVSVVRDEDVCRGCGMCASICPYGAIEMVETEHGTKARMIEVACKGCGTCAASCYVRAITMVHYTDDQIGAQLRAAFIDDVSEGTAG
jgi:heterodisulfide reductase subunit A